MKWLDWPNEDGDWVFWGEYHYSLFKVNLGKGLVKDRQGEYPLEMYRRLGLWLKLPNHPRDVADYE